MNLFQIDTILMKKKLFFRKVNKYISDMILHLNKNEHYLYKIR